MVKVSRKASSVAKNCKSFPLVQITQATQSPRGSFGVVTYVMNSGEEIFFHVP
jgi:hypothetical protein